MQVLSEKDTEVLNEKHKSHIKDITQDFAIKTMQTELTFLTEKFLRAEGTMTARGIFEHTFEIFHLAAGLKGRFNVAGSLHHAEWLLNGKFPYNI